MSGVIEIVTTVETLAQARELAGQLVERRAAACVQIDGPIRSVYRWQAAINEGEEYRVTVKTLSRCVGAIDELFKDLHPYDLPQWIQRTSEPSEPAAQYAKWVSEQVD